MKVAVKGTEYETEVTIVCYPGIFSPDADKTGSVFIYGGDGRAALALVEQARMLYQEYPEDCLALQPGEAVLLHETGPEVPSGLTLLLAKGSGFSLLATAVDPEATREALQRLQRYVTRLVRMDVP